MPGGCGVGHRVEKEDGAGEDADGDQAGGTGGEGFAATTGWRHLEDGDNNKKKTWDRRIMKSVLTSLKVAKNKKQQLVGISIRAREGKKGGELTEKVIDCVVTSKW